MLFCAQLLLIVSLICKNFNLPFFAERRFYGILLWQEAEELVEVEAEGFSGAQRHAYKHPQSRVIWCGRPGEFR